VGAPALSHRELLAVLIGSGSGGASALRVADRILAAAEGRLRTLGGLTAADLETVQGVGRATSARILAALELGRRTVEERLPERPRIRGPSDVFSLMAPRLRDLPHEEFHVLLLNSQHRVLDDLPVTRGILDASLIHPREVFRPAIVGKASAIVLVHNHPSGDPTPSSEDRAVTRQMVQAGRAIGIRVLDHVIVSDGGWDTAD
jgi:DNA repair protein RadC